MKAVRKFPVRPTQQPSSHSVTTMTKEEVVEAHRGLVIDLAMKVSRSMSTPIAVDDLISFGFTGLLEAHQRFDPTGRNNTFASYAYYRIRGAIYDGIRKYGWASRGTPCQVRDNFAINDHLQSNHEARTTPPKTKTFADSVDRLDEMVGNCVTICLVQNEDFAALNTSAPAHQESDLSRRQLAAALQDAIDRLDERERRVVTGYHFSDESFAAIADELGLSRSWVSRVHARAIDKMRKTLFGTALEQGLLGDGATLEDHLP